MRRNSLTCGVESLEHRLLMAVLPSLPAEATADYAPAAPRFTTNMAHIDGTAANAATPAAESMPKAIAIAVEHGAESNVLMLQFRNLDQPQLVAVVGGAAASTDSEGAVHFEISHSTRQIELTLAGERYLHIGFDADGRIERYTLLQAASAEAEQKGTIVVEVHAGNSVRVIDGAQTGLGIAMLTPTGASAIHHAQSDVIVLAPTGLTAPTTLGHTSVDHGLFDFASHQLGMAGLLPTGSGTDSLMSAGDGQGASKDAMSMANRTERNRVGILATAAHDNQAADPSSPAKIGGRASSDNHETVEAVFADWAGGEEAAPLESRAMFLVDVEPERSPSGATQRQSAAIPHTELLVSYNAEQLAAEFDPEGNEESADINDWGAVAAFVFSAACAAGAYALERRADQGPTPSPPVKMRRRTVRAPSTGSMAKAAM